MIIRREHNGNFTIVPNAIFGDRRLSIEAIGLLGFLLSRPPNWHTRHGHLQKTLGIGRQKLERALRLLMAAGYLERDNEQPRDGSNQFSAYNYVVRDVPAAGKPLSGFPLRGSRCRKPDNGNKTKENKTDSNKTPSKSPPLEQATPPLASDEGLSEFGLAARDAGMAFVFEGSGPWRAWIEFAGEDRLPISDVITAGGVARRGVWMSSLYPPTEPRERVE